VAVARSEGGEAADPARWGALLTGGLPEHAEGELP